MKKRMLSVFVSLLSFSAMATPQFSDRIIYKGTTEYGLISNPLEQYFELFPEKRLKPIEFKHNGYVEISISSALHRGYIATFEIIDNQLYVKDIVMPHPGKEDYVSVIHRLFPDSESRKADWYSGFLLISYGELVRYTHMDYASLYESYKLLEIVNGELIFTESLDTEEYKKFRDRQFEIYKRTDEYNIRKEGLQGQVYSEEFLKEFVSDYVPIRWPIERGVYEPVIRNYDDYYLDWFSLKPRSLDLPWWAVYTW
jgi:hypothetical protein